MELSYLVLMGSMSGLISVLGHSVLFSMYELVAPRGAVTSSVQITDALLHLICGAGLGLLFWLSWGLAAIVDVPWWLRGLSFAALCWIPLSLPTLLNAWISTAPEQGRGLTAKAVAVMASRWAMTCLIAGLTCAWSWQRSV